MEIFADSLDSVHGMMALRIFQETFGTKHFVFISIVLTDHFYPILFFNKKNAESLCAGGCVFAFSMSRVADMVKIGVYRMFVLVGSMTYWSERTNSPSSSEEDQRIDRPEALAVMFVVENEIERSLHCDYWAVKQQAQSHGVVMVKLFRELLRDIGYMWLSAECEPQLLKDYVRGGAINTGIDYYFINTDNKYFPMHFVVWPLQNQMDISLERVRGMATVVIQELRLKVHGISGCPLEGRPPKNFQRCDPLESLIRSRRKNAEYLGTRSLPTTMEMEPSQECTCFILPLLGLIIRRSLARRRTQPT